MDVEQYLAYERGADTRHEFVGGDVWAMAGESERHNQITSALNFLLYGQLLDRDCAVFQSDMRVKADEKVYFCPDIVVVCGETDYADDTRDILLNPTVVIEVLSPSKEDYDRGRKFTNYRKIASLRDYVLVAQSEMNVEHHALRVGEGWLLKEYANAEDRVQLLSIDCTLTLSNIYRKVTFDG
ncbi:MAG: Uma2 family endonuclease [Aggregatilineales bacterium]